MTLAGSINLSMGGGASYMGVLVKTIWGSITMASSQIKGFCFLFSVTRSEILCPKMRFYVPKFDDMNLPRPVLIALPTEENVRLKYACCKKDPQIGFGKNSSVTLHLTNGCHSNLLTFYQK